jgi:hypothetical protein
MQHGLLFLNTTTLTTTTYEKPPISDGFSHAFAWSDRWPPDKHGQSPDNDYNDDYHCACR